jgi:exosortase
MATARVEQVSEILRRHLCFASFFLGSLFVFWMPLRNLIHFALSLDYGSHILLIAPVSAYLIHVKRRAIFSNVQSDWSTSSILFLAGTALGWFAHNHFRFDSDYLSVEIVGLIILWEAGFILCYGTRAFRLARFPFLFLLLMVPIPSFVVDKVILFLQTGSATVAYWLLAVLHVPVLREGFILRLPALDVEVAKECSGIRSSLVLLITTLLVGEFVLRSIWRKSLLVLSILPIVILKNGMRIVAISLLTIYVNRRFLHGWLHQSGGIVFYLIGLLTLAPILMWLKRGETDQTIGRVRISSLSDEPRPRT